MMTLRTVLVVVLALTGAAAMGQDASKAWYLSGWLEGDEEHRLRIERIRERASSIPDTAIPQLVGTMLITPRGDEEYWTLAVLGERAVPALVQALRDPRFHTVEALSYGGAFGAVQELLQPLAPEQAVPAYLQLLDHPNIEVRRLAASGLAEIGSDSGVGGVRSALRSDDLLLREFTINGLERAKRLRPTSGLFAAVFDDVARVLEMESNGGTRAPDLLLRMDRTRGAAHLLDRTIFRADHREIASIVKALADARVVAPSDKVISLLDALERQPRLNTTAFGFGLQMLALSGHPSAERRIENAMSLEGRKNDYQRSLAADAYLLLNGIPNAYDVAIGMWGRNDVSSLPEPIRNYATAHVMLNEVGNGGFDQYFFNSSGDDVRHAIAGLDAIGAKHAASLARRAVALFGEDGPSPDRKRRQAQLDDADGGQLAKLSEELFEDRDRIAVLLARYVVRHKAHFVSAPASH